MKRKSIDRYSITYENKVTNIKSYSSSIVRSGDAIYVRVGDYDLTRKLGSPGAQTLRVATTYIHHNHNSQTLDNDIALLKLHGQAELREGVCLVCSKLTEFLKVTNFCPFSGLLARKRS